MSRYKRPLLWGLFAVYLLVLLRITVFRSGFGTHPLLDGTIVWVPFMSIFELVRSDLSYFIYLFVGNIIWFVPFGFLWPLLTGQKRAAIALTLLLSLVIETLQFVFGTGFSEVEDLILNTLGGAIGYGLYRFCHRFL